MDTTTVTILFTDVYDGSARHRTEDLDLPPAPSGDPEDEAVKAALREWADEHLEQHTGSGVFDAEESGYFAEIINHPGRPELAKIEFSWGV